jgi:hypothetical protein
MRLIAMVFDPSALEIQTAIPSIFSFSFNGLQRLPKLATSSEGRHSELSCHLHFQTTTIEGLCKNLLSEKKVDLI